MCVRIFPFIRNAIKTCIYIAIDVIVFFICSLSDFIESLEWPVIQKFYAFFKVIGMKLFEENITYSTVPHLSGEYDIEDFQRGNAYVEDLLHDINDKLVERTFCFEDAVVGFQNTRIIPIKGELKLHYSVLMDYRIMRSGNCSLREGSKRSRVNASLKGCELYLNYFIDLKIADLTKTFKVTGNIPYIEAYLEFSFDNETLEDGRLAEFIVIEMFGTNLKFKGAGLLNFIPNFASKILVKVFKRRLMTILQGKMRSKLAVLIETFNFPAPRIFETPVHAPRSERLQPISEESEHSTLSLLRRVRTEASDPQHFCHGARTTEQQLASPEEQGKGPHEENSSSPGQQMQSTAAEASRFTDQDSSPELPNLIPLKNDESSQSTDCNATVETDCSLKA